MPPKLKKSSVRAKDEKDARHMKPRATSKKSRPLKVHAPQQEQTLPIGERSPLVIRTQQARVDSHPFSKIFDSTTAHRITSVLNRTMMAVSIGIVAATLTLTGFLSFAEEPGGPLGVNVKQVGAKVYGSATKPVYEIVGEIVSVLLGVLGVIFAGFIIYAGFLWMTDQGKGDQSEKAKGILQHSVVGLIIVVASYVITNFVITKLAEVFK